MLKSLTNRIVLLNASLTEVRQTTIGILGDAGVLQDYVKKINVSIIQASERSLAAFNETSVLMNETAFIHDHALRLSSAIATAQSKAQATNIGLNKTSSSALDLLQTYFPSLLHAVNLSTIINNSKVPNDNVAAVAANATSILDAANLLLWQSLNISSSAHDIESLVAGMEPSVNKTAITILMLQRNISKVQQLITDLDASMQSATATASTIHDVYIQVTNVLTEVNRTMQSLDASYGAYQNELDMLVNGILQNLNTSQLYWKKMEELAASFTAEPEMAYNVAVGNNEAAKNLLSNSETLKNSPTDNELQELLSQYLNEMTEIDDLTATSAQLQKELEDLTNYFRNSVSDLNECYKTP